MFGTVQMSCTYNCMSDLQDGRGWPSSFVLSQVFTQGFKEVDAEISRPGTQHTVVATQLTGTHTVVCTAHLYSTKHTVVLIWSS